MKMCDNMYKLNKKMPSKNRKGIIPNPINL